MAKKRVVGVSISPEIGLEVAVVDYASRTVVNYGRRPLDYSVVRREVGDLDIFKSTLQELMYDMSIPKGSEIVLNVPTVIFKINDYPASMDQFKVEAAIEEDVYDNQFLKNYEPCYSYAVLPTSTMQFNRVAYTAVQKSIMIEMALFIKEMGYKIKAIDTSVNSELNALMYLDKVNVDSDVKWTLLTVEDSCCRISSMIGRSYVDFYEELISIGEVLTDAENYATVISAVEPILRNLPSKYLCIVSKTNAISAEILSNKITYSAPIIYQESNGFLREPLLQIPASLDADFTKTMSLAVIGASVYADFVQLGSQQFNLFNSTLGDIYLSEQPPVIFGVALTNEKLIALFILIAVLLGFLTAGLYIAKVKEYNDLNAKLDSMQQEIDVINAYLKQHEDLSADIFDEGDEIRVGLQHNKNIYSYYTIVGTEIPKKLWLTGLKLGDKTTIEGQADNLESVYSFFKNIKDYNASSDIKLQKLGLATSNPLTKPSLIDGEDGKFDTDSILTTLNADFYEFKISNESPIQQKKADDADGLADLEIIN